MAASQTLIDAIDQVIAYFNSRRMDLPDGLFDRKTQFVINGATFESLLSTAPNDPLIMMLARGPAGYRFTAKALQHAMPDAKLDPSTQGGPSSTERLSLRAGRAQEFELDLWLRGTLRGTGEAVNALVTIKLTLAQAGQIEVAEASIDPGILQSIRDARVRA